MGIGRTRRLRIFLAEDHLAIREMLAAFLASSALIDVVGQAADGREVIDACLKLQPELLVLDVDLPGLSGISIARRMTAELPDMPILMFTSHYDRVTVQDALEAGARGIIEKTAPAAQLLTAIESVASGKAYFGEKVTQMVQQSFMDPVATRTADGLTTREREVLQLVAEGLSNKEISSRLNNSVKTVENHRHNLMRKLNAHNSADLTREAFRLGVLKPKGVTRPPLESSDPGAT